MSASEVKPGTTASQSSYIPSLDGLRAVSILIVFLSHAGYGHIVPGGFGVTIFFFLSGYLITTLLTREWDRHGEIAQKAFYLRRVVRLAPPILITLIVSLGLAGVGLARGSFDLLTVFSQIFFFFNYYALYASDMATVEGLGILWSLAVEEHFYLIWPTIFILLARGRLSVRTLLALLVAILLWRMVRFFGFGAREWTIYISTDTRFDSLLYGCLLALLMWTGRARTLFPDGVWARSLYILGALVVLLLCLVIRDDAFRSTLRYSLQGLALMPVFYYAVTRPEDLIFRPLSWGFMRKIGLWSYTIYLIHHVIIKALVYNGLGREGDLQILLLSAVLSAGFAAAVYRWAEKPLHPLRRKLTGH